MRTVDPIAPGAAELAAAGGITYLAASAKCELCGEWTDGPSSELKVWARHHAATAHDALRPSVLGLDPSLTRAGIAIETLGPGGTDGMAWPSLLTHIGESGHTDAPWDTRCDRLVRQLGGIIGLVDAARLAGGADIRLAVIEAMIPGMSMGHAFDRGGLWWPLYAALRKRGIPIAVVHNTHRAKFICGVMPPVGDRAKTLVCDETKARYAGRVLERPDCPDIVTKIAKRGINNDVADALGMADMGAVHLDWPTPWQKRRRHVENVHLVDWPEVTP